MNLQELRNQQHLTQEIMVLHSILSEVSFNQCQTIVLDGLVAKDFEFYHDQSGITGNSSEY